MRSSQGLRELGWSDGRNVRIDYRYAAGDIVEMQSLARRMVALRPDVIFAASTPVTVALHRETRTIPVVFVVVSEPGGCWPSRQPLTSGGNITGLLNVEASMGGKWVELLNEIAPGRSALPWSSTPTRHRATDRILRERSKTPQVIRAQADLGPSSHGS